MKRVWNTKPIHVAWSRSTRELNSNFSAIRHAFGNNFALHPRGIFGTWRLRNVQNPYARLSDVFLCTSHAILLHKLPFPGNLQWERRHSRRPWYSFIKPVCLHLHDTEKEATRRSLTKFEISGGSNSLSRFCFTFKTTAL